MKMIHIADLHFGKGMHGVPLLEDQRVWAERFLALVREEAPDAILIAGDVYDRSAPGNDAVELLSWFLTQLAEMDIPVLIVSGNHDSGTKLSFLHTLLESRKVYISGVLTKTLKKITLTDAHGEVDVWLMPYVFPALAADVLQDETIRDYDAAVRKLLAAQEIDTNRRNVLVAHQNVLANGTSAIPGGSESMVGGVGEIDYTAFDAFDYVALGHIHAGQKMGREGVRYAGSPLCYHFDELRNANKGALIIELGEKGSVEVSLRSIAPAHPLRCVTGSLREILQEGSEHRGEYIQVMLTDDPMPLDAHQTLKSFFESKESVLMELCRQIERKTGAAHTATEPEQEPLIHERFAEYFYSLRNQEPDDVQRAVIEMVADQLGRDGDADEDVNAIVDFLMKQEDKA